MSKPQMAGRLAHAFIHSKLTPLFLVASIALGVAAVIMLPREEEPQIIVPMIDVTVSFPGASAKEVETRIAKPMERLLCPAWRLSASTWGRTKKRALSG
jgi:multidrug efflux pump subunit AcrB